jgi:hypothetical protein
MKQRIICKALAVAVILLFIGFGVQPAIATSQDDIKIYASAGIYRNRWGRFGLGWVLMILNHGNETIFGECEIKYYTLSLDEIRNETGHFSVGPFMGLVYEQINFIDFPPINYINITVEAGGYNISRSGIEIGPFVLLLN